MSYYGILVIGKVIAMLLKEEEGRPVSLLRCNEMEMVVGSKGVKR